MILEKQYSRACSNFQKGSYWYYMAQFLNGRLVRGPYKPIGFVPDLTWEKKESFHCRESPALTWPWTTFKWTYIVTPPPLPKNVAQTHNLFFFFFGGSCFCSWSAIYNSCFLCFLLTRFPTQSQSPLKPKLVETFWAFPCPAIDTVWYGR